MQTNMKTIVLNLTAEQLMILNEGLMLVAFGKAAPVVAEINKQLTAQTKQELTEEERLNNEMILSK